MQYSLLIQWSVEDECFLATCPELMHVWNMGGAFAHGDTWEEAAKAAQGAISLILDTMEEDKTPLPEPQYYKWKETHGAGS